MKTTRIEQQNLLEEGEAGGVHSEYIHNVNYKCF